MHRHIETGIIILIIALFIVALFCGCTSTTVQYGHFRIHRVSFCQSIDASVTVSNDFISVRYSNDGGKEVSGNIAGGVIKAVVP